MNTLHTLLVSLVDDGDVRTVFRNPLAQFGRNNRLLGAQILPEREVPQNEYTEMGVRYRTVIAVAGTRYGAAQKRAGGVLVGSFKVELGESDVATEYTGAEYDATKALLRRINGVSGSEADSITMQAGARILDWADETVNQALIEFNEMQRWQAIVTGQIVRRTDNVKLETVVYPTASGHRVASGGSWASDTYDPFDDLLAALETLVDKGYPVTRLVMRRKTANIFLRNAKVAERAGFVTVIPTGTTTAATYRQQMTLNDLNTYLQSQGFPVITTYDEKYFQADGTRVAFLPEATVVLLGETGRREEIDLRDVQPDAETMVVENTLGYTAIGTPTGQDEPGRAVVMTPYENKPPRIECEGWQTSLPVILDPEALFVITSVHP